MHVQCPVAVEWLSALYYVSLSPFTLHIIACFMSSRLSLHLVWSYIASVSNIQGGLKKTRSHCLKRPPGLGLQIYLQLRVTLTWPLTFCFRVVAQWVFGKPVRSYFSVPPCSIRQHLLSWVLQFTSLTDSADGQQVFLLT